MPQNHDPTGLADSHLSGNASEIWRTIPGSEGHYSVSSVGRVRSEPIPTRHVGRQRGRILTCSPDNKRYPQFCMCLVGGRRQTMKVHRAVALAFLGPRPEGHQINHRSGDKTDNRVENLEYVSCRENIRHAWRTGLCSSARRRGMSSSQAKLTDEDVREIRRLGSQTTRKRLAQRFGVTPENIACILKGQTWQHVA